MADESGASVIQGVLESLREVGSEVTSTFKKISTAQKKFNADGTTTQKLMEKMSEASDAFATQTKAIKDIENLKKSHPVLATMAEDVKKVGKEYSTTIKRIEKLREAATAGKKVPEVEKQIKNQIARAGELADEYKKLTKDAKTLAEDTEKTSRSYGKRAGAWAARMGGKAKEKVKDWIKSLIAMVVDSLGHTIQLTSIAAERILALGTYGSKGFKSMFGAIKDIAKDTLTTLKATSANITLLGYTAEDAKTAIKAMALGLRGGIEKNLPLVGELTSDVALMARAMSIDLGEAMDFAVMQSQRFNKSGKQIRQNFVDIWYHAKQSGIRINDFTRLVIESSHEIQGYGINLRYLSGFMAEVTRRAQKMGYTQKGALDVAKAFTGVVTKDAPEWVKYMSGRGLMKALSRSLGDMDQRITKVFGKVGPNLRKRIKEVLSEQGKQEGYDVARALDEVVQGSAAGIMERLKTIRREFGKAGLTASVLMREFASIQTTAQGLTIAKMIREGKAAETVKKLLEWSKAAKAKAKGEGPPTFADIKEQHGATLMALGQTEGGLAGMLRRLMDQVTKYLIQIAGYLYKIGKWVYEAVKEYLGKESLVEEIGKEAVEKTKSETRFGSEALEKARKFLSGRATGGEAATSIEELSDEQKRARDAILKKMFGGEKKPGAPELYGKTVKEAAEKAKEAEKARTDITSDYWKKDAPSLAKKAWKESTNILDETLRLLSFGMISAMPGGKEMIKKMGPDWFRTLSEQRAAKAAPAPQTAGGGKVSYKPNPDGSVTATSQWKIINYTETNAKIKRTQQAGVAKG